MVVSAIRKWHRSFEEMTKGPPQRGTPFRYGTLWKTRVPGAIGPIAPDLDNDSVFLLLSAGCFLESERQRTNEDELGRTTYTIQYYVKLLSETGQVQWIMTGSYSTRARWDLLNQALQEARWNFSYATFKALFVEFK